MFTKAYLFYLKVFQNSGNHAISGASTFAAFKTYSVTGTEIYLGAPYSPLQYCPAVFMNVPISGSSGRGVYFSDDNSEFADITQSKPAVPVASGTTNSFVSSQYSVANGKYIQTVRFNVTNTTSAEITLRKFCGSAEVQGSLIYGGSTNKSYYVQAFVKEITPVTIPAGGAAIIDVTVETEIPE